MQKSCVVVFLCLHGFFCPCLKAVCMKVSVLKMTLRPYDSGIWMFSGRDSAKVPGVADPECSRQQLRVRISARVSSWVSLLSAPKSHNTSERISGEPSTDKQNRNLLLNSHACAVPSEVSHICTYLPYSEKSQQRQWLPT